MNDDLKKIQQQVQAEIDAMNKNKYSNSTTMRKSLAGRAAVENRSENYSLSKIRDPEKWKKANAEASKRQWENPARREKHSQQMAAMNTSPEVIANKASGIQRRASNETWLKNRNEAMKRTGEAKRGRTGIGKCQGIWRGTAVDDPTVVVEFIGTAALEQGTRRDNPNMKLRSPAVSECAKGKRQSHGGYIWEYIKVSSE